MMRRVIVAARPVCLMRSGGRTSLSVVQRNRTIVRALCAGGPNRDAPPKAKQSQKPMDPEEVEETAVMLTPAQKVSAGISTTFWVSLLGLAVVCGYFIVRELFPTRMSPNSVFDRAFEVIRSHPDVQRVYGDPIKGYGRDHGGHREGRRNFIENTAYEEKDGSKRLRVRFNIKGAYSEGFVFAEVSNKADGFVYLMVQDKRTGRVITVEDRRLALSATTTARSDAERDALQALLGGSSSGGGKTPW